MNYKNLNYEIETVSLPEVATALYDSAMNYKNLNYEIETLERR